VRRIPAVSDSASLVLWRLLSQLLVLDGREVLLLLPTRPAKPLKSTPGD